MIFARYRRRSPGSEAEDKALAHLQQAGLQLLSRNYRCRRGEIDLIMRDGDTTVLIEVRQRSHPGYGSAVESVTIHKQRRLIAAASHWLARNPKLAGLPLRFDVIGIDAEGRLDWIRNAFQAEEY